MLSEQTVNHYCKDLLNVDDQIVCVTNADDNGGIVALDWKKGRVPWENNGIGPMQEFESIESKLGAWMQIILVSRDKPNP